MFVRYDECVLGYVAAIRDRFGLKSAYDKNEIFAEYIKDQDPEKIFIVLIDGLGSRLLERKLSSDSFLLSHLYKETMTVFPPTTVAATTSIQNGHSPNQNGWLGWTSYFKEVDDTITLFMDEGYYDKKKYEPGFVKKIIPVKTTVDELNSIGIKASTINPYYIQDGGYDGLDDFGERILKCASGKDKYVYAYYDKYDSCMHKNGVDARQSDELLKTIDAKMAEVAKKLPKGVMLVIMADHGLIDLDETINIADTELLGYLKRPCAIEPRAAAFYIKDGMEDDFAKAFKKRFEDDFILLTKEEVKKTHLFGKGQDHPRFDGFIGDFIAIAKGKKDLISKVEDDGFRMKAAHAGCTLDELMIPIITYIK